MDENERRSADRYEATRPAPAVEEGPEALDVWVREQFEQWRAEATLEVVQRRHEQAGDDPAWRAVTLCWLLGTDEDLLSDDTVEDLAGDLALPVLIRARLTAVLARARVDTGDLEVADLIDRTLALVEGADLEAVAGMRIIRNVVEAALASGDDDAVERALTVAHSLDLTDTMSAFLLDGVRLLVGNARRRAAEPEPTAKMVQAAELAARDVLDAAPEVLDGGVANPLVVLTVLDATSTVMEVADSAPPHGPLQLAVDGVPARPDTAGLRAQAYMMLADLHLRLDGPAVAMVHQGLAIDAASSAGVAGLEGWARRGLGLQLQGLGRHAEATVQFARSVELLRSGGDPVNAWIVETSRARCLLDAGDPASAATAAEDVIAEVDGDSDLPDRLRTMVLEPALDLAVEAEIASGGHRRAASLLARIGENLDAENRPSAPAWSMAAMCEARSGEIERAEELLLRAELSARPGPGPEHDHDLALVHARRVEMLWQIDRNLEAIEVAAEATRLAEAVGDRQLAAVIASFTARAEHDRFSNMAAEDDPGALAQGDRAVEALVHAIQDLQVLDLDELAEHLGERLDHLRHALDDLRS
ncbi:MAG: hypothetical protein KDB02_09090 [Acidimicrobiales bacterium]|nr:hypothetical protein [Acidimicrobiales bacterium]